MVGELAIWGTDPEVIRKMMRLIEKRGTIVIKSTGVIIFAVQTDEPKSKEDPFLLEFKVAQI